MPDELTADDKLDILQNPVDYGRAGSGASSGTTEGADRGTAVVRSDESTYVVDLTDGSVRETS